MHSWSRALTAALLALGLGVATPAGARAYTLKRTEDGAPVHWREDVVRFRVAECEDLDRQSVLDAARIAADAWRGFPGVPDIEIVPGDAGEPGYEPAGRNVNGIYVLPAWPFRQRHLAVTSSTHEVITGRVVDTDILVNGEMPLDLMDEGRPTRRRYDLASVLTHEMGHVLGLDESDVAAATMWPVTRRGDVDQRTLDTDDEEGVLAIYGPDGEASALDGGCTASGGLPPASAPLPLILLTLLAVRPRRRLR